MGTSADPMAGISPTATTLTHSTTPPTGFPQMARNQKPLMPSVHPRGPLGRYLLWHGSCHDLQRDPGGHGH
eukprot:1591546-Alexandrium_andersonii.AAC.1